MILLGHRGARRYAAENTFAAFDLALEHGCDGFEFDVRLTADARLIICHGARLGRRSIARSTLAALSEASARGERRGSAAALPPPCLEDVLERYAERAFLDIELKVAGLEQMVLNLLRRHRPRRVLVSSFWPDVLQALRERERGLRLGFLSDRPHTLRRFRELDVQVVLPHYTLASRRVLTQLKAADKEVIVWTVNRERSMRRFAALGVDGMISDDTALLARAFRTASQQLP